MCVGVKSADGIDFVVEQVHTVGHQRAHGEQIDQAATHGVLARAHHLRHMAVTGHGELLLELGIIQLLLDFEMKGVGRQKRGGC